MVASSDSIGLAAAGFISCAVALPPLIIQIQQQNIASSVLVASIIVSNFIRAVNALIWNSLELSTWWEGRGFCDMQIRLSIALDVAIPGAATCIFRQLSLVFCPSTGLPTRAQKRRTRLFELMLCVAIPVMRAVVLYVVQPDRYWIARLYGCTWTVDTSWPTYVLIFLWPFLISILGLVYAAITGLRMLYHIRTTSSVLGHSRNRRNKSRIIRLYSFGLILFLTFVPLQIVWLYQNIPRHLQPYSWSRIHPPDWSERIFKLSHPVGMGFQWLIWQYFSVFYSISVAILVGLGPGATDSYKAWLACLQDPWKRLTNKKAAPIISNSNVPCPPESDLQPQVRGRNELEAMSDVSQDREGI